MDFAPYQSSPPEASRALSPPISGPTSPRASLDRRPFSPSNNARQTSATSPPPLQHPQPQRKWSGGMPSPSYYQQQVGDGPSDAAHSGGAARGFGGGGEGYFGLGGEREGVVSEFDTSLGIRLDYEACLAYLACPPLGAILLLILERKSDYVRFHAWQSSLVFTVIFVVHLIFSWSTFLGWVIFLADLGLIAFLTMRAYRDADTLDRYELPVFGQLASRFLDDE